MLKFLKFYFLFLGSLRDEIKRYIRSNSELYLNVLLYKVVQLKDIVEGLRFNGIKFKLKDLMEELDEQVIFVQKIC